MCYLLCGSLFHDLKKTMLAFCPVLLLNAYPFASTIISLKQALELSDFFVFGYFLIFIPNYALTAASLAISLSKYMRKYKPYYDEIKIARAILGNGKTNEERGLEALCKLLIGIKMPIFSNYIFSLFLFFLYLALCIIMLSCRLSPNYRMRLNKNCK